MSKLKVLAIASSGGHWTQLMRLIPAFKEHHIIYVTTNNGYRKQVNGSEFYPVSDATRWQKLKLIKMGFEVGKIVLNKKPDVVVSTGAAPGLMAIIWAWLMGKQSVWIDSIANVDRISMSGRIAKKFCTFHLTQWEHLADNKSTLFKGTVIK
ncbi:MAG: glycosyltransferase [Lentimicrobiaceae bacterium]|nr:glycosyltransferase [Lentimicrobiaceae bacterium]